MLLPVRFNDGSNVPDELIGETITELREQFGAVSADSQFIQGMWTNDEQIYRDDLLRVYVDVRDTAQNHKFFRKFKERLKKRFRQLDIWMTTYPIDVV